MHILLLPSWYKTPSRPALGSFFEEQARMLMRRGHTAGILYADIEMTFSSRWKTAGKEPAAFTDNGLPTYYSFSRSIVPRNRRINYWYVAYKARKKFREYMDAHGKPDIIHAHSVFHGGIVAAWLSRRYKIPFVLTEHYTGLVISGMRDIPESYRQVRRVFGQSARNIAVSSDFRQRLIDMYGLDGNKISVVHNVVNPLFLNVRTAPVKRPFLFVVNAFLTEKKNHSLLFRAFKAVIATHPCLLKVIGDGKLRRDLEGLAGELGIEEQVIFYGNVGRQEVKEILDESHALVSSSTFETFGVNIIEALASGRPVVATDSGGPRDIINAYNGILVGRHTVEDLSNAMVRLIENYDSYDQRTISEMCQKEFGEEIIYSHLSKIYQNARDNYNP